MAKKTIILIAEKEKRINDIYKLVCPTNVADVPDYKSYKILMEEQDKLIEELEILRKRKCMILTNNKTEQHGRDTCNSILNTTENTVKDGEKGWT